MLFYTFVFTGKDKKTETDLSPVISDQWIILNSHHLWLHKVADLSWLHKVADLGSTIKQSTIKQFLVFTF